MLKDREPLEEACRSFRQRFQPGELDHHREICTECSRYAELLESSISTETRRPMPTSLRQRLRAIPRNQVTCRDVERLYRSTLERAGHRQKPAGPQRDDETAREHLASCARCRGIYETLESAFAVERLSMPVRLARRLTSFGRHPLRPVPWWIRDSRYAAAACYLLAASLLTLADDASAVWRDTTEVVSSKAQVWAVSSEDKGARLWSSVAASLSREWGESQYHAARYTAASEKWVYDAKRALTEATRELLPDPAGSVEGEHDDGSRHDGT